MPKSSKKKSPAPSVADDDAVLSPDNLNAASAQNKDATNPIESSAALDTTETQSEDSDTVQPDEEAVSDNAHSEPGTGEPDGTADDINQTDLASNIEADTAQDVTEVTKTHNIASSHRSHYRLWVLALCLILLIGFGVYQLIFSACAFPGVQLAGQNMSGKTQKALQEIAANRAKGIKLTLKTKDSSVSATPTDVGITFDPAATAKNTLQTKKHSLLDRLQFWRTENVPLVYKINRTAFDAYMQKHLISGWKLPVDAKLAFNPDSKQYDIVEATPGQGIHMYQVAQGLDKVALQPGPVTIPIKPVPTNATIGQVAAQAAQKQANTLLGSDIQMFYRGQRVFYFEPSEIDTLIDIIPRPEHKDIEVAINPDRVQEFVDTNVTNTIARAARDQVSLVNPSSGEKLVIQEGVRGQKLVANKKLAADITTALISGKSFHPEIEVEEGGYTEKTFTGVNRWAEVNLTRQEAYMHLDDQIIQTFRISSGRAATPSDPGEWAVSRKFAVTTMRGTINGESYVVPNVPWVSYFNPDGEAFHGAYWHNNFGTPMSHGCINMTVPDAHMMYNFTYIGMRVSVHY
jgi:hypothetical protein